MKNLPKEWLIGGGAALLAAVLFVTASSPEKATASSAARGTYDPAPPPEPRWLPLDLSALWASARDPFQPSTDRRDLPAEDLGLPTFPSNPVPNLPFRPAADPRAASPKLILVPAADLPTDDELTTLRAKGRNATNGGDAVAPAVAPDVVVMADGTRREGSILDVDQKTGSLRFRPKTAGGVMTLKKGDYTSYEYASTPEKEYTRKAAELAGGNAKDHENLAEWCLKNGLMEFAAKEYSIALSITKKLETIAKLGDLYQQMSEPDLEIRMYREILDAPPFGAEAIWLRLGRVYESLGLPTRAMDAYQTALKTSPFHAESRQRLAVLFAHDGNFAEADSQLARLAQDPKAASSPETRLASGIVLYLQGRLEPAKTDLLAAGPAGAHVLGCAEAYLGNPAAAVKAFEDSLTANPDQIDSWLALGLLCGLGADWAKAQACFEEASFRAPLSPHPLAATGWALHRQNKLAEAKAAYDEALKRDPRCAQALLGLGKLALDADDSKTAEEQLLASLKAGAGAIAFRELGLARLRNRNTSGAVEALRRAVEFSADPDAHALLGFALLATNPAAAEVEFRKAIEADRDHLLAQCGLASVAYNQRNLADAKARFENVLSRDPQHPFAQRGRRLANEASTRTLWEDDFERKDGDVVKKQWFEKEKEGLKVAVSRGRATFNGRQNKDDGVTAILRATTERFLSFEAELDFSRAGRATAGITVALAPSQALPNPQVIRFVRNSKGRLASFTGMANQPPVWTDCGEAPADMLRMKIERGPAGGGNEWILSVNGTQVGNVVRADMRGGKLEVGAFGTALKDESWELGIDNVKLIEAK